MSTASSRSEWEFSNSLWIGWTFTFGFFNWVPFLIIGFRVKHIRWMLWGVFYSLPFLSYVLLPDNSPVFNGSYYTYYYFGSWIASIVHAFAIRKQYLVRLTAREKYEEALTEKYYKEYMREPIKNPTSLSQDEFQAAVMTLDEADRMVKKIRSLGDAIIVANIKNKVSTICLLAERLISDLEDHPQEVKAVRRFLSYYLETTYNILSKYFEISSCLVDAPEIDESNKKVEPALKQIIEAFEKQLLRLIEDDCMELDAEIKVLDNKVKMDGL